MKRTKIIYKNTQDGRIRLVKFLNVATIEEIEKEFGKEVARLYTIGIHYFKVECLNRRIHIVTTDCNTWFSENEIIDEDTFSEIIYLMKLCGDCLQEIVNIQKGIGLKTVII